VVPCDPDYDGRISSFSASGNTAAARLGSLERDLAAGRITEGDAADALARELRGVAGDHPNVVLRALAEQATEIEAKRFSVT
jgi:hypothetical protein